MLRDSYRGAKRVAVFIVGATVLLLGALLLFLPGPGLLVVFFGLTLLATEFVWARLWLRSLRVNVKRAGRRVRSRWRRRGTSEPSRGP